MIEDDVIRGVRAAREAYCEQFGYDLEAIARDLSEGERTGGRRVVRLAPRRPSAADVARAERILRPRPDQPEASPDQVDEASRDR